MKLNPKSTGLLIAGGAIAGMIAAGTSAAMADDSTTTTTDDTTTTTPVAPDHGRGMHGDMTTITDFLGLTEEELHTEFAAGKTLAEITEAQGKSVDELIDLLVAEAEVEITERVNSVMPAPGEGHGGPGRGHGGPDHHALGETGDSTLTDPTA